ncbi:HAD-IIB family hydrolase [Candidatus Marithrix sp. Canyon 246]|uniref:HAD-IIB family hydrolase n=1 Tax=Candidatus Marithrix sp. Canyon 246 TaxID=1827136 RepID=UPI000849FEEC|nr:HAD-IIB family hydrolase [Candidatus Marithrix sp. Canyon 246]
MEVSHRIIISDIDNTLLGDTKALGEFINYLKKNRDSIKFGIATGRHLESAIAVLEQWQVPTPDFFITAVGSQIHNATKEADENWLKHIDYCWKPDEIRDYLSQFKGLSLQPDINQGEFKISYFADQNFEKLELPYAANVIYSHGEFLDILPVRASKGLAVSYLAKSLSLPMTQVMVAGDSGNDAEMLTNDGLGIVVGNYSNELENLKNKKGIYFAQNNYAAGILEGIKHFDW